MTFKFDYDRHRDDLQTIIRNLRIIEILIRRYTSDEYHYDIEGYRIAVRRKLPSLTETSDEKHNSYVLDYIMQDLQLSSQLSFALSKIRPQEVLGATQLINQDIIQRDIDSLIWMLGFPEVDSKYVKMLSRDLQISFRIRGVYSGRILGVLKYIEESEDCCRLRWNLLLVSRNDGY